MNNKVVVLTSGGLDSSVMIKMLLEEGQDVYPLFVNYGQINYIREYESCTKFLSTVGGNKLSTLDIKNFGSFVPSGITDSSLNIVKDAFLPNRNLLFLAFAASYAFKLNITSVAIGLLSEKSSIFPDQSSQFISSIQNSLSISLGVDIKIITPLFDLCKKDVVQLAKEIGILDHYSCHAGTEEPCGICIACKEYNY